MKNKVQNNMLELVVAGLVLILVNVAVWQGVRNGHVAPADSMLLWGAFAAFTVCALLWAVTLMGLQPVIVALAYAAGGLLAFLGVRSMSNVNVAEITTAGAAFSAFGALLVGHATTRERKTFFSRRQIPFVFIIVVLAVLTGLLNSRISQGGWDVISKAAVFPFLLCGIVTGTAWRVFSGCRAGGKRTRGKQLETPISSGKEPSSSVRSAGEEQKAEAGGLLFAVPEESDVDEPAEAPAMARAAETVVEQAPDVIPQEAALRETDADQEDDEGADDFFPLEIDNGEEIEVQDNPDLLGVAAMVAESAPRPLDEVEPIASDPPPAFTGESPALDTDSKPADEPVRKPLEKKPAASDDWLNNHLELLSKIGK